MLRRNWLELSRKLVDQYDLDYTLNAIQAALGEAALSYWGEGVLPTTFYPNPFPITMSGTTLGGTVGNGIGYDPNGQITRIDTGSTTSKAFTDTAADNTLPRWDLLVISYAQTGDTPVPKPSDPITTIDLNLHDDFVLATIPGAPSATPNYPAKPATSIILAGIRVPAGATLGTQCVVDYSIREMGAAGLVQQPDFVQEPGTGAINGTNQVFALSQAPMNPGSLLVMVDDLVLTKAEWSIIGQNVTLATAPAPGQSVFFYYVASNPSSQNPLSGAQESPSGVADGTNDTFSLVGKPANQVSTLVMVDGIVSKISEWSLVQTLSGDKIKFNAGFFPAAGQVVYCFYLVNPATVGVAPVVSSGGNGGLTVFGSPTAPIPATAAGGVVFMGSQRESQYLSSSGGPVAITANPQVAPGTVVGQELVLHGTSDTDYIEMVDGFGLSLNGPISLTKALGGLYLEWNGVVWTENSRR